MGEKKSYLAGAEMAVLFGTSFLASKTALRFFDQPMILAWRFFLAAVILMLFGRLGIVSIKLKGKPWYHLLGISIVYPVLSYTFEMKGVDMVPSSQAGVIVSLMPVFILIFGRLFLGERPKMIQYVFTVLSAAGVVVISLESGSLESGQMNFGIIYLLLSALCGAGQAILVRKHRREFNSLEITLVMNIVAAVFFNLQLIFQYKGDTVFYILETIKRPEGLLPVLYLGIGCSIGATFCLNYVNSHMEVARASIFHNLSTVISVLVGVWIAGDRMNSTQILGIVMILVGVWGVNHYAGDSSTSCSSRSTCS